MAEKKKRNRYPGLYWFEDTRRWRGRKYGRAYYFPANGDETKDASYKRCLKLWKAKKLEIEAEKLAEDPQELQRLQNVAAIEEQQRWIVEHFDDSEPLRKQWEILEIAKQAFQSGTAIVKPEQVADTAFGLYPQFRKDFTVNGKPSPVPYSKPRGAPPWEDEADGVETTGGVIEAFIEAQRRRVDQGEITIDTFDNLRTYLRAPTYVEDGKKGAKGRGTTFETFIEPHRRKPLDEITSQQLFEFADVVRLEVGTKEISADRGKRRLQVVKSMFEWALERDIIDELPRPLQSPKWAAVKVPAKTIETMSDAEIASLLACQSDRTRLYFLLALNCGMLQSDISELRQSEVDWKAGTITRKRSKTRDHENVPTVTYKLWPATFKLLKAERASDGDRALTNDKGEPLVSKEIRDGKMKKTDNIRSAYKRAAKVAGVAKAFKLLRKNGSTKLASHSVHRAFSELYLGHSPRTISEKHYTQYDQASFDAALVWLGEQFLPDAKSKPQRTTKKESIE